MKRPKLLKKMVNEPVNPCYGLYLNMIEGCKIKKWKTK